MALYEEKVSGDPNYLEQLRAEGRALGLTDEADQPPDESTMLLRLSARMHVLEKENEELKVGAMAYFPVLALSILSKIREWQMVDLADAVTVVRSQDSKIAWSTIAIQKVESA